MKIWTIGNGFIANHLPYDIIDERVPLDDQQIKKMLEFYKPDVLVNCVGFCGKPNIDQCEEKKVETYLANVSIPTLLAAECEKLGIHFIHIGSGCIFFGKSPNTFYNNNLDDGWKETDFANPQSYYSKTKYACDLALSDLSNTSILRIRMPISDKNDPRNFINKIRNYTQIINIPNSMTMVTDLVKCIDWAAKNYKLGLYHVVNPQPLTAVQVMEEYQKYRPNHQFSIISEAQLDQLTKAKRSNCLLNTDKLTQAGFDMTPSETALQQTMASYFKNI